MPKLASWKFCKGELQFMDERRGDRFGRYEILSELGRGAVGVVFKARDPKINRVVAIKTFSLAGQSAEDEKEFRERFVREAEAAGRLSHPGIVTIFDVGEEDDTHAPYIVMEYVGGKSLDKVLAANDNRLQLETALQLTHELAEALDCAHGQGVVHRDLKPANILITEDGHAKIADFGVAKLNLANLTLAGRTLGTPAYMSPEQLNGEAVDGRSDLFSLGVVLYTVLTGYRPFQGNSAMTVSFKVVNRDPIPASVLDTDLPQGLDYIIGRAMAKDPAQRYQRGMEMALDIQDLKAGRELWSRAKQSITPEAAMAQAAAGNLRTPNGPNALAGVVSRQAGSNRGLVHKVIDDRYTKPLAAALFVIGIAVFGLNLSPLLRSKKAQPANQTAARAVASMPTPSSTPVPVIGEDATPKMVAQPVTSAAVAAGANSPSVVPARKAPKTVAAKSVMPKSAALVTARLSTPVAAPQPTSTLDIEIEHKFAEAHLSIWVDSKLSYTRDLEGTDKKRLGVFHNVQGHEFHAIQIPSGHHQLKVQVLSDPNSTDHSGAVAGDFTSGKETMLKIHFDKHGEMNLSLD
jgi:serine/threonine protein kinase